MHPHEPPMAPRPGRHHAARGSRGAALALSIGTTVGLGGYLYGQTLASDTAPVISAGSDTTTGSTTTGSTTTAAAPATSGEAAADALADGTYVGDVDTNRWGPVQVQITVESGTITDISVLQYRSDDRKSVEINRQALPIMIEESLSLQSADVDTVSGATYTSDSYAVSLQSAIDAARADATA